MSGVRRRDVLLAAGLGLLPFRLVAAERAPGGRDGIVHDRVNRHFGISTNHPLVTAAARSAREAGGGALDMLVAAMATSWVVDPANSSPYGRIQGLVTAPGEAWCLHAATRIRHGSDSTVPVPGNIAAVFHLRDSGELRLPLARSLRPAIAAARRGFAATPALHTILARTAAELDPALRGIYLDADGHPRATVVNPQLAAFLRLLAQARSERDFWASLGPDGPWGEAELLDNAPRRGEPRRLALTGPGGAACELQSTANLETWGSWTLLGAAVAARLGAQGALDSDARAHEAFLLASILLLERIPFAVGTLVPKVARPSVEFDIGSESARLAAEVGALLRAPPDALQRALGSTGFGAEAARTDDRNTTHFAIADGGRFAGFTTSIGPWFGSRRAWWGAALGYSYAMRSGLYFDGQTHDVTELSPVHVLRDGRPWLGLGAAGSERILGSLTWLLFLRFGLGRTEPAAELMRWPRLFPKDGRVRIHHDLPAGVQAHLRARGFRLEPTGYDLAQHLGIVNLVEQVRPGVFRSGADPSSSGAAY